MTDLFELYLSFQSSVNTFQGGWYRPESDFRRACNDISNDLWNEQVNQAEKSEEIKANLIYFLKSKNIKVEKKASAYGLIEVPSDYGRKSSLRIIIDGENSCFPSNEAEDFEKFKTDSELAEDYYDKVIEVNVKVIDNVRWGSANKHETKKATFDRPLATQMGQQEGTGEVKGGFKIAPRDISVVVLDYYVRPRDAVFAYTLTPGNTQTGSGDQIVYDKAKSLPLQWPTTMINEFLIRLGERYGAYTRDQFLAQHSTQQKKK